MDMNNLCFSLFFLIQKHQIFHFKYWQEKTIIEKNYDIQYPDQYFRPSAYIIIKNNHLNHLKNVHELFFFGMKLNIFL